MQQKQIAVSATHNCVCGKTPKAYHSFGVYAPSKYHLECAGCGYRTVALFSLASAVGEWTRIISVVRKDMGEHNAVGVSVVHTLNANRSKVGR